jgi:KAP family P-loop domain
MVDLSGPFFGHVILDAPAEQPALSFPQIADALASIIQSSPPRFAVGIFGGWGSGKSTLMDAIRHRIEPRPDIISVEFNAWRYEREPHLIIPLLDTIRDGVWSWSQERPGTAEGSTAHGIASRIGKVVRALVRSTSVDVGIPGAVSLSIDPGAALDEMTEGPGDEAADPQSLYYGAFRQLTAAFNDVTTAGVSRIVVFVDDLDRCMPEHALDVLESMKLFFDMPGFVFVVGLDEHVVESAVHSKFASSNTGQPADVVAQLERDYLKKIFQVPYTLPAMVAGQLDELLWSIENRENLSDVQRDDLRVRVSRYLRYVAADGRINPREVKRFINAYTLSRMIRPDLNANVILALQTLDFRADWERLYDDVILAEPDVASAIIRQFRDGDDRAFDDLWPTIGVIPPDLSAFLRSREGEPLSTAGLDRYVTFLETTRSSRSWLPEALKSVGALRQGIRTAETEAATPGSDRGREIAAQLTDDLNRLNRVVSSSDPTSKQLEPTFTALRLLIGRLGGAESRLGEQSSENDKVVQPVAEWSAEFRRHLDQLQQQLRILRRSAAFSH